MDEQKLKRPFWGWLLSEADGTPSTGRFLAALMTVFVLGWDTAYLVITKQLPPSSELLVQAAFASTFYSVNGLKTWMMKDKPPNQGG